MRLLAVLLALVAVPLLGACGGGEETAGDAGAAQVVDVSASDFEFDPPDISVEPGEVTFRLTNDGDDDHALEIEGNGIEEASDVIAAGESTDLTVTLDPGEYEIYCPVGDHADRGMTGTLTVGAGTGGAGTDGETGETETGETDTGDDDSPYDY